MSEASKKILEFKRTLMRDMLLQCTDKQRAFFNQLYVSVDYIKEEQMEWAFQQIEETIKNNSSLHSLKSESK